MVGDTGKSARGSSSYSWWNRSRCRRLWVWRIADRLDRDPGMVGVATAIVTRITEVGRTLVDRLQMRDVTQPPIDVEGHPVGILIVDVAMQVAVDRFASEIEAVYDAHVNIAMR